MSLHMLGFVLRSMMRSSVPLILAALGGVVAERSGVVNLALEGLLLVGAFGAMLGSYFGVPFLGIGPSPALGICFALALGALLALLLGVLAIRYKTDQIVAGVALNILAVGATNYLLFILFGDVAFSPDVREIPWTDFVALAVALVVIVHFVLYYTPLGLRIRAVGEHPRAADTLGVNVYRIRYLCVVVSGLLASLGGAYLSISYHPAFQKEMSQGRGYIALAAMIFGKWTPFGALGASLFFGFADALQISLQGQTPIPDEFFNALPYLLTLIALVGLIGKARPPAADGIPYDPTRGR
ncbi:MAG: ABC transporter permease [Candidatus Xenobia bacterium]